MPIPAPRPGLVRIRLFAPRSARAARRWRPRRATSSVRGVVVRPARRRRRRRGAASNEAKPVVVRRGIEGNEALVRVRGQRSLEGSEAVVGCRRGSSRGSGCPLRWRRASRRRSTSAYRARRPAAAARRRWLCGRRRRGHLPLDMVTTRWPCGVAVFVEAARLTSGGGAASTASNQSSTAGGGASITSTAAGVCAGDMIGETGLAASSVGDTARGGASSSLAASSTSSYSIAGRPRRARPPRARRLTFQRRCPAPWRSPRATAAATSTPGARTPGSSAGTALDGGPSARRPATSRSGSGSRPAPASTRAPRGSPLWESRRRASRRSSAISKPARPCPPRSESAFARRPSATSRSWTGSRVFAEQFVHSI